MPSKLKHEKIQRTMAQIRDDQSSTAVAQKIGSRGSNAQCWSLARGRGVEALEAQLTEAQRRAEEAEASGAADMGRCEVVDKKMRKKMGKHMKKR